MNRETGSESPQDGRGGVGQGITSPPTGEAVCGPQASETGAPLLVLEGFAGRQAATCSNAINLHVGPVLLADVGRRGQKLPTGWTHKVCPGCRFIFERAEYRDQSRCGPCRARDHTTPTIRAGRRRAYAANRDARIAKATKWKRENRDRWLDAQRKHKYGLPHGTYERMLAEQNGGCAICGAPPPENRALHVDHDHQTKQVRGLLCDRHNRGLGYFQDDPALLRTAAEYLEARR